MRYPAREKIEIVRLVEQSSLPVRRTLALRGFWARWCSERRTLARLSVLGGRPRLGCRIIWGAGGGTGGS